MDVNSLECEEKSRQALGAELQHGEPSTTLVYVPAPTTAQCIAQIERRLAELDKLIFERMAELDDRISDLERNYELLDEVQYQLRSSGRIE